MYLHMMITYVTPLVSAIAVFSIAWLPSRSLAQCPSTLTDVDGNVYPVLHYGTQCWMGSNLRTSQYANGASIPTAVSDAAWQSATNGRYAYYDNNSGYNAVYGKLYNWFAVADPRGLCPDGWHAPSIEDWTTLELHLGMPPDEVDMSGWRGNDENVGGRMKSDGGLWYDPEVNVTNTSQFSAEPAGLRVFAGPYQSITFSTHFWSTDITGDGNVETRTLNYFWAGVGTSIELPQQGFSCRCVWDQIIDGVDELKLGGTLRLAPNPGRDRVIVTVDATELPVYIAVHDAQGRTVSVRAIADSRWDMDVSGFARGAYIIKLIGVRSTTHLRLLVE